MAAQTCEAGAFAYPRASVCFAQANKRKNLGRDPVCQRMKSLGGEGNCKGVANRLRKTRRAPHERIPLIRSPAHATPRSNASFETTHRLPAAFPELPSWPRIIA